MPALIIRTATNSDFALIRSISEQTWPSAYGHIISQEQIDFMLGWMYSDESLAKQMEEGHLFYIANNKGTDIGFCSVSASKTEETTKEKHLLNTPQAPSHKLNKLYILPQAQGTGAGSALLNKAIEVAKTEGSNSLFLQVNKHNNAYDFYIKKGFVKEGDFIFEIGNGFVMDDYVMRLYF